MTTLERADTATLSDLPLRVLKEIRDYAIVMMDPSGRILTWNDGAQAIKGYAADEILGQNFARFFQPEDLERESPRNLLSRAAKDGRAGDRGWRVRKDGTRFWADVVTTAIHDDDGSVRGFIEVTRDLTERAEEMLGQSDERSRLLIESVTDYAIFMLDPTGTVVTWNAGAQRIKGYSADEVIGKHFSMFYTEEDRLRHHPEEALEKARVHDRHEEEGWLVRKDGSRFWASAVIAAAHDPVTGEIRGFSKVTRDMTARRQAEHERIQRAKAEEAVRLRDEFLSIAAHELKTPLTSLQLQVSGVVRGLEKLPPSARNEKLNSRLRVVGDELDRFEALIDDLLDITRTRTGQIDLNPEPIDLGSFVTEVVNRFEDAAVEARSSLSSVVREPVVGRWDRLRLEQIITKLVTNALRFGAGAPIEVLVGRSPTGMATLEVCDHGIGIEASRHAEIFDRFVRAVSTEHYGGFGLGLWMVHAIVEAMDGSVGVRSTPGSGSTFTVTLPLDALVQRVTPDAPAGSEPLSLTED